MTPNEEILQIIRYAPGPIGASAIYEKCKSIESISDVSSRLSQLHAQGKVAREEITTPNNRNGFAYTLPKPAAVHAESDAATDPETDTAAPAPAPKAKRTPRSRPDPVANGLDQPEAALKGSAAAVLPAPIPTAVRPGRPEGNAPAEGLPGADPARLADAILARLRRQLAPAQAADAGIPASMSIHIAHLEIHLGGL